MDGAAPSFCLWSRRDKTLINCKNISVMQHLLKSTTVSDSLPGPDCGEEEGAMNQMLSELFKLLLHGVPPDLWLGQQVTIFSSEVVV